MYLARNGLSHVHLAVRVAAVYRHSGGVDGRDRDDTGTPRVVNRRPPAQGPV